MRQASKPSAGGHDRITVNVAFRGRVHKFSLPPALAYLLFGLAPLTVAACLSVGGWLVFRDDMLAALMRRQAQMQFAYEDRIAALRGQVDHLSTRQMLNQDSFEGKVAELAVRQARLESRSALIASLVAKVEPGKPEAAEAGGRRPGQPVAAHVAAPSSSAPAPVSAPLAIAPLAAAPKNAKPAPEGFDLRRGPSSETPSVAPGEDVSENLDPASPDDRLRNLAENFERIERRQIAALDGLSAPAAAKARQLRLAFAEAGLPVERMIRRSVTARSEHPGETIAVGGPFEPAPAGGAFDQAYASARTSVTLMDELRRALPYAPLRQPLPGFLDITSSYGVRTDPFLGRPALHTGMDMRGDYGDPIRATAAGRVVTAGGAGGYGNLVEIDHGAGLATRYGHMSQIDVDVGDWVDAGEVIGHIGSTGRSTGPHLHYEVRVDGAAVDPSRYLRAGKLLNAGL